LGIPGFEHQEWHARNDTALVLSNKKTGKEGSAGMERVFGIKEDSCWDPMGKKIQYELAGTLLFFWFWGGGGWFVFCGG